MDQECHYFYIVQLWVQILEGFGYANVDLYGFTPDTILKIN